MTDLDARGLLVSAVSHDLRGGIAAILGFAELLAEPGDAVTEEARLEYAHEIMGSARRMRWQLSDLVDLDRVARGTVVLRRQATDVVALAAEVAAETGGALHRAVEVDAAPVVADVDPALVQRMLENLVTNAAKFTRAGTPIRVRVAASDDAAMMLAVEDAGPGVPEADREVIFDPFRRGSNVAATAPGSGIGLYLVRTFAQLHGGDAWVEDGADGGASFRVRLPAGPAASAEPADGGAAA